LGKVRSTPGEESWYGAPSLGKGWCSSAGHKGAFSGGGKTERKVEKVQSRGSEEKKTDGIEGVTGLLALENT